MNSNIEDIIHKKTVKLVNLLSNIKSCEIGLSIKKHELKKISQTILELWLEYGCYEIPSKQLVINISQSFDQKYGTNYHSAIFLGKKSFVRKNLTGTLSDKFIRSSKFDYMSAISDDMSSESMSINSKN